MKVATLGASWLVVTLACSSPTDIVGVVDGTDADAVPAATSGDDPNAGDPNGVEDTSGDGDVALLLAGRPLADWVGGALEWPLSTPLAELFAAPASDDRDDRTQLAPWQSRRLAASSSRGDSRRPDGVNARASAFEARLLILDEDDARELLALLSSEASPGAERAAVFRDEPGDVYQVSLESDERRFDLTGCGGRLRREPSACGGRGPFD